MPRVPESDEYDDKPREECGVVAVITAGPPATGMIVDALHALQHRGQESAGLAVSDGTQMFVVKDTGLVSQVLTPATVGFLEGAVGIGHVRYSTSGDGSWTNAQPQFAGDGDKVFSLAHNGSLIGLQHRWPGAGADDSDTVILSKLVDRDLREHPGRTLPDAVSAVSRTLSGAFCLVFADHERIVAVRDPNGFRPLCLGRLPGGGWAIVSETAALDAIDAEYVREIAPGEMVTIGADLIPHSTEVFGPERVDPKLCSLEFAYLARPDSRLSGTSVHTARIRMGQVLARKYPVDADAVIGVPESGLTAAAGFARESGIPLETGLVRNRYTGRSFIEPTQGRRDTEVRRKLNVLPDQVAGRRLVVVDDSIVRGTVTRRMVQMLYAAGASEVHLRVTLPPVRWPCFYGIDIGSREGLLAVGRTVVSMAQELGVDSLEFLDIAEFKEAIGPAGNHVCTCCLSGEYPTAVPAGKLEGVVR